MNRLASTSAPSALFDGGTAHRNRRHTTLPDARERRLMLAVSDLLVVSVATVVAFLLWAPRVHGMPSMAAFLSHLPWAVILAFTWSGWLLLSDLYDLRRAAQAPSIVARVISGGAVLLALYLALFFLGGSGQGTVQVQAARVFTMRLIPMTSIAVSTVLLVVWRLIYARAVEHNAALRRRLLIVGSEVESSLLASELRTFALDYDIIGTVHPKGQEAVEQTDTLLRQARVDEVVLCDSDEVDGALFQTLMDGHALGLKVTTLPLLYERVTGRVAVEHIGSQWFVALPVEPPAFEFAARAAKRTLDLVGGVAMLAVFLIVLPFVALAIRLDSQGPLLYNQTRLGLYGRPYRVLKFRTMVQDAERDGAQWAASDDARITRVGRFLRRSRLDELPQVFNVLRGEMSLVGPRPERPEFIDVLQRQIPFYRTRLTGKPGVTGWAQVRYGYGSTVEDALIKLQYDLYYLRHQSLLFDLSILMRTVSIVVGMKGQ